MRYEGVKSLGILQEITNIGIIPVIKINDSGKAASLAEALKRGGIPCAEVTFRTSEAATAINKMTDAADGMIIGAGTVTTIDQVDEAILSGARFIVTPGFNEKVVEYCLKKGISVIPGVFTASEIGKALEYGIEIVKFFPAEQSGGIAVIKALSGPYKGIKFVPTGGITEMNINNYLSLDCVAACGGSFIAEPQLVDSGKYDEIEMICKRTVNKILAFRLKHVGINSDEFDAHNIAGQLANAFGFIPQEGNSSIVSGGQIEVTKRPFPGAKGHLAIGTNSIERAIYYLERRGFEFNYDTVKKDSTGKIIAIYLKNEIGGFAVHLARN